MHLFFLFKMRLPWSVLAVVMTAVFDATGTIHVVASQAKLLHANQPMKNESKA